VLAGLNQELFALNRTPELKNTPPASMLYVFSM
jgi:hypothetical protein